MRMTATEAPPVRHIPMPRTPVAGDFPFSPATDSSLPEIDVFWASGTADPEAIRHSRIVFVMHGVLRNGDEYRDIWARLAHGHKVLVIAPMFDRERFPAGAYSTCGLGDAPPGSRALDYIEPLFDQTVRMFGGAQTGFDMFGHSAGAQFVHRYVEFAPRTALRTAVAANAGWYTLPKQRRRFPYGMKNAPEGPPPEVYLRRRLVVMLGSHDVARDDHLRTTVGAMKQGSHRLERGRTFYEAAQKAAFRRGLRSRWRLRIVHGAGHDAHRMSAAAAHHLFREN